MAHWYVMYTKPRLETQAVENLERQNYRVFYPQARVRKRRSTGLAEVVEPLFPRYLFVRLESGVDDFSKLRSTKGCIDLVKFGGKATPVPQALVDLIQSQLADDGLLHLEALNGMPKVGSSMRVADGPFEGLMATIAQHKGADRVLVLLNVLGGERRVVLSATQLQSP
ncbi:transcriptional activator RfaH [Limnobacter humi]|uniref:Transcriptional activator RfaH n=1 Tax=Limnobacter humi TaxID=1778671 RepID=A0ABT1WIS4_9BURK|nr:transcriptional activator RfaH [Limnobacter humi]MCQ8897409.1 transcriptional activator RfaH [Limnobacter humi]